jgi:5-methylthioadenosine/S-adenosylhomocysteine deaminase
VDAGQTSSTDLVVLNARVNHGERWSEPFDIAVAGGRIASMRSAQQARQSPTGATVIDARGDYAIPGLVNGHTHAHNALLRATGDDRWLEMHILRMAESSPSWRPDDYYAAAAVGALEMVRTGTTVAVDMVSASGPDWRDKIEAVMRAYRDVGMAATIAPTVSDIPFTKALGPLDRELAESPRRALDGLEQLTGIEEQIGRIDDLARSHAVDGSMPTGRVHLGLGPINPVLCTDALLESVGEVAARWQLSIQTHCMESKLQALAGLEPSGATAVDRLDRLGLLDESVSLAHAVWLSDSDMEVIAGSGAVVVHCPASNMKLGSGVAPVRRYLDHGVSVQLGTDGSASGDNHNMFQTLWLAALLSHVVTPDPDSWITAPEIFELGARSRFVDHPKPGELVVGAPADITLLRANSTFLTPRVGPPQSLVYSEAGLSVRTVIADGEVVFDDGHSTRIDETAVIEAVDCAWQRFARDHLGASVISELAPALRRLQQRLPAFHYPVERHPAVGPLT